MKSIFQRQSSSTLFFCLICVATWFVAMNRSLPAQELTSPQRNWTDKTGRFTVEAKLQSFRDGKVKLEKADGLVVELPLTKLSEQDQAYIARLKAESQMENPFAGGAPANPFAGGTSPAESSESQPENSGLDAATPIKVELPADRKSIVATKWESPVDPAMNQPSNQIEAGPIAFPSFAGRYEFHTRVEAAVFDRNGSIAAAAVSNPFEEKMIISVVDFSAGDVTSHASIDIESRLEQPELLAVDSERREVVTLVKPRGREPGRLEFRPFDRLDKPAEVWETADFFGRDGFRPEHAYFVGKNRLLTIGENLILWDRDQREPNYVLKMGLRNTPSSSIAFSPGGNLVAIANNSSVVFVRVETGEVEGKLNERFRSISISPDGTQLAGSLFGKDIKTFDLMTGDNLKSFSTLDTGAVRWLDNRYLMVGNGHVFDTELQAKIWEYQAGRSGDFETLGHGVTVVQDKNRIKAIKLPHIDLSQQVGSLDKQDLKLIEDGSEFSIELNAPFNEKTKQEVIDKLKTSLAEQGFGYNEDSNLVIKLKVTKGKKKTVNVRSIGGLSAFGSNTETMTFTPHHSSIKIVRDGKSIWNMTHYHGPGFMINQRDDESLKQYARRVCKPSPEVLHQWKVPSNTFSLPEGKVLGTTNLWEL